MTDFETIKDIFERRHVPHTIETDPDYKGPTITIKSRDKIEGGKETPGYSGFLSVLFFSENGELLTVGSWEG